MTSITEILQKVTSSDDFHDFDGSPESWYVLMIDKLLGRPSVPMLIRMDISPQNFDTVQILINDDGSWRIGDGHHRLVTAILRADDFVPTTHTYDDPTSRTHESSERKTFNSDDYVNARWLAEQIGHTAEELLESDYASVS